MQLNKSQLLDIAKELNIKNRHRMNKQELSDAIESYQEIIPTFEFIEDV